MFVPINSVMLQLFVLDYQKSLSIKLKFLSKSQYTRSLMPQILKFTVLFIPSSLLIMSLVSLVRVDLLGIKYSLTYKELTTIKLSLN